MSALRSLLFVFGAALLFSCVSTQSGISSGIQPAYRGSVFARLLFVPVHVQPNPSKKAAVDRAAVASDRVVVTLEKAVTTSFRNQPGVNGISPKALSDHLSAVPDVLTAPINILDKAAERLISGTGDTRELLSRECKERNSYLDYFSSCVAPSQEWRDALVNLSKKSYNADAALFVAITSLEKSRRKGTYSISMGVVAYLVDLNNGRLIWGREAEEILASDPSQERFPEWQTLFARMFSDAFWVGFPGRRLATP
jgi:hypothetical protein